MERRDINSVIEGIEVSVKKLVADKHNLQHNKKKKDEEIERLKTQIKDLTLEIDRLKRDKQINNLTNIITNNSNDFDAKVLINDLLKKINRSISIISKDDGQQFDDKD